MAYIIGIILFIITLIIAGLIFRKRVYDNVDRYEGWKMDIMNRNIASQLSRIKTLNLSGETQEKFEAWKERWEVILTKELPDIEEYLFDAEEAADRYRFSNAKKVLHKLNQNLESIEKDIEDILNELDELLESEETSRKEIEDIQPMIKTLRRNLSQSRYQYGAADVRFDNALDKLESMLKTYDEKVNSGDYLEARQLVQDLKKDITELEKQMEEFPALYRSCNEDLPDQLDDLFVGLKSMKDDGYRIEHLGFEKDIHDYKQRLRDCIQSLEQGEAAEVKTVISEMDERIKEMYQLLEKEAIAKNYIEAKMPSYRHTLSELAATFSETKEEVDILKEAYYFEDSDMEKYLTLEKSLNQLSGQLHEMSKDVENESESHTVLREQLESGFEQLKDLQERHVAFKVQIQSLRKDELEAKEKLLEMRDQINRMKRKIQQSNIPGVPSFIWTLIETAMDRNGRVISILERQPLDIAEVQTALTEAKSAVENAMEQTDLMLEQAYLTEQVIQYANRYRSKYPLLAAKLSESERLFRSYEYELSLEHAATAIEEIEPGALKRIEANQLIN